MSRKSVEEVGSGRKRMEQTLDCVALRLEVDPAVWNKGETIELNFASISGDAS